MNKKILTILLATSSVLSVYGQHTLSGSVFDDTNLSIPAATVQLLTTDSVFVNGTITDEKGLFSVPKVQAGKYIVAVSCIGYTPQTTDLEMPEADHTLPRIVLKTDNIALDEVVVKGSSYIQKKDHLLVIPDKQQVKHSFTGYDLLYNLMIPGLNVDRKKKSVSSMVGEATIYINGVKADFREVQNLQPKDIEKVEYYTMPVSGPFVGDAAAINYITKVHNTGGYITIDGEQNIGYLKGDYNVGSKISHGNTNYTLFGGHTMQKYDGVKSTTNEDLFFSDYTINRHTANDNANYRNNQQYAQFKVSNDTRKHNISGMFSIVRDATPDNDINEALTYTGANGHDAFSTDKSDNKSLKSAINLNGLFHLDEKQQLKFRLNGSYTQNKYNRFYAENKQESSTNADEDFYAFDAQVAYLFQPDSKNTFYPRITHFHNVTSSLYGGDYDSWQHLWKGESLFQFDYIHTFGKNLSLLVSPGASWLNYKLHGNALRQTWTFRANAALRYFINPKHGLTAMFSLGNNQPDIQYLNSMDQTIDFYQIKRGNPYLDNTKLLTTSLLYEGQVEMFSLQGKFTFMKNDHNIFTNYYLEGDKLISSYSSDGSFNTASGEVSISSRISEHFRANLGLKYQYMYVPDKKELGQKSFSASLDINYFIKAFAINAYVKSQEKTLDQTTLAYLKTPASYGFSLRYSGKKWMAEVGTENPFTKEMHYREHADYGVYRYNQVRTSRIYQQTAYLKLAYTFDFGKKTSRDHNNVDRTINSAILKAK